MCQLIKWWMLENQSGKYTDKEDQREIAMKAHSFFSPPVHIARWAHMHRFLSVCLSVCQPGCTQGTLYTTTPVCACTWLHSKKNSCQQMDKALLLWQVGLIANVNLHFYCLARELARVQATHPTKPTHLKIYRMLIEMICSWVSCFFWECSAYCRVPARWGLQQTHPGLRAATRHGVRDPLVCSQRRDTTRDPLVR